MKLVRGLHNLSRGAGGPAGGRPVNGGGAGLGCVLTVGNYDGVHLGHQHMIHALIERAAELRCKSTVLVFEPSSKEFIDPAGAPPRLTRWREKFLALAGLGVDRIVTLRFDDEMRAMSPQRFVDELIAGALGARHVVVGDDFRYGAQARGTIHSLRVAGQSHGFGVEQVAAFVVDGVRVSSTAVRERLERGDCAGAARLLGRPYRMMGRVVYGEALGRTLGFPTANLRLRRRKSPLWGIFAVRVYGIDTLARDGVASLGTRPTVSGVEPLLEVHVFDFDGDLYGRAIEVEFIARLRDEVKFDSLDSLRVQMQVDAAQARDLLSKVDCG
ncbi:MAG: bifunctional riboflavin kinase/FAD synthetase [Pseudomonadota bacterium]|nr:bifunctional riboflavin kinase/FAD synthetase [Pseudomonadota bacterium]